MYIVKWVEMDDNLVYHAQAELFREYEPARDRQLELEELLTEEVLMNGRYPNRICSDIELTEINDLK